MLTDARCGQVARSQYRAASHAAIATAFLEVLADPVKHVIIPAAQWA